MSFSVLQAGVRFLLQMSLPEILINQFGGGGGVLAAVVQHKRIFLFMFSVHFLFSPILNKPAAHLTVFCFE